MALEFHASEEEQHSEADLREEVNGIINLDPAENLWSENNATNKEQNHLSDSNPDKSQNDRNNSGNRDYHKKGEQVLIKTHKSVPCGSGGTMMRNSAVASLAVPIREPSTDFSSGFVVSTLLT